MSGDYNNSKVISSSGRAKAVFYWQHTKNQKGQSVKEGTKEKDVGEQHLSVSHPEKEVNCLQGFQYNHRFLNRFFFFWRTWPSWTIEVTSGNSLFEFAGYRLTQAPPSYLSEIITKENKKNAGNISKATS